MLKSPLSQGRGLKLVIFFINLKSDESPLSQGRGLKLRLDQHATDGRLSPLSQGRGLKLIKVSLIYNDTKVAPFTGAWIETGIL